MSLFDDSFGNITQTVWVYVPFIHIFRLFPHAFYIQKEIYASDVKSYSDYVNSSSLIALCVPIRYLQETSIAEKWIVQKNVHDYYAISQLKRNQYTNRNTIPLHIHTYESLNFIFFACCQSEVNKTKLIKGNTLGLTEQNIEKMRRSVRMKWMKIHICHRYIRKFSVSIHLEMQSHFFSSAIKGKQIVRPFVNMPFPITQQ